MCILYDLYNSHLKPYKHTETPTYSCIHNKNSMMCNLTPQADKRLPLIGPVKTRETGWFLFESYDIISQRFELYYITNNILNWNSWLKVTYEHTCNGLISFYCLFNSLLSSYSRVIHSSSHLSLSNSVSNQQHGHMHEPELIYITAKMHKR